MVFAPDQYRAWATRPDQYWPALIQLHHGMRIGEACQLATADFVMEAGIQCLRVTDETVKDAQIKTRATRRSVPLHPALIGLGLMDYVADVHRIAGPGLIFPYLRPGGINGFGDVPGEVLNSYLKACLKHPRKRSHSLRHTVNERLKQARIPEEWRCEFIGHSHETVNSSTYSHPLSVSNMQECILPKLHFPIAYEALRYQRGEFDKIIRRRVELRRRERARRQARVAKEAEATTKAK